MRKPVYILTASFMIILLSIISSCERYKFEVPAVDPNTTWHLSAEIQPIFNNNCVSCHGGSQSPDLREGNSYEELTGGGYVTLPAETSRLYTKITSGSHVSRSTDAEKLMILYWIQQGALNN